MIDCIYIAASARDGRFTRICVASVRYFYPNIPIRILVGGPLQWGLAEELKKYWDVEIADLPMGDYGWGFIKLEPLFMQPGHRFLILDSDTVIAGPVLDWAADIGADFIVDKEEQTTDAIRELYYDCEKAGKQGLRIQEPDFVFNSGQWFGRSGVLRREEFSGLIDWNFPVKAVRADIFKCGEQGFLNFTLNEGARAKKINVARVQLMRWPKHGMEGLDVDTVSRKIAAPLIVHWAGLKKARLQDVWEPDLLRFFERKYYERLPGGSLRRNVTSYVHVASYWLYEIRLRIRLRYRATVRGLVNIGALNARETIDR